jgi:hypothetical protein
MRHLTPQQAQTNLSVGKPLEQWLDRTEQPDGIILRWIRIRFEADQGYIVGLFEAIESERASYDIYGIYARERDEDGAEQQIFGNAKYSALASAAEAITYALQLGAAADRFVNDGFVQDEYLDVVGRSRD